MGLDLSIEGAPIAEEGLKRGLIINCTHEHILRMLPPFIVRAQDIREFLKTLEVVLAKAPRKAWQSVEISQLQPTPQAQETAGAIAHAAAR